MPKRHLVYSPTASVQLIVSLVAGLILGLVPDSQAGPYDTYPDAEPPYYRIHYKPKEVGDLSYGVNYTVWIPEGVCRGVGG